MSVTAGFVIATLVSGISALGFISHIRRSITIPTKRILEAEKNPLRARRRQTPAVPAKHPEGVTEETIPVNVSNIWLQRSNPIAKPYLNGSKIDRKAVIPLALFLIITSLSKSLTGVPFAGFAATLAMCIGLPLIATIYIKQWQTLRAEPAPGQVDSSKKMLQFAWTLGFLPLAGHFDATASLAVIGAAGTSTYALYHLFKGRSDIWRLDEQDRILAIAAPAIPAVMFYAASGLNLVSAVMVVEALFFMPRLAEIQRLRSKTNSSVVAWKIDNVRLNGKLLHVNVIRHLIRNSAAKATITSTSAASATQLVQDPLQNERDQQAIVAAKKLTKLAADTKIPEAFELASAVQTATEKLSGEVLARLRTGLMEPAVIILENLRTTGAEPDDLGRALTDSTSAILNVIEEEQLKAQAEALKAQEIKTKVLRHRAGEFLNRPS